MEQLLFFLIAAVAVPSWNYPGNYAYILFDADQHAALRTAYASGREARWARGRGWGRGRRTPSAVTHSSPSLQCSCPPARPLGGRGYRIFFDKSNLRDRGERHPANGCRI